MVVDYKLSPDVVLPIYSSRKYTRAIEYDAAEKRVYWIDGRAKTIRRSYDNGVQVCSVCTKLIAKLVGENLFPISPEFLFSSRPNFIELLSTNICLA